MQRCNLLCLLAIGIISAFPVHGDRDEDSSEDSKAGASLEAGRLFAENLVKRVEGTCESGRQAYVQAHDGGIESLKKCVHALEDYAKGVRKHEELAYSTHGRYRRAFVQTYALLSSVLEKDKKNLYKFKETFKADHAKAADYLKNRLDKIKETADEMGGQGIQDSGAQVSSLLSQSSTAVKRQSVHQSSNSLRRHAMTKRGLEKSSTRLKKHAVKNGYTAGTKRALKKMSTIVMRHAVTKSALQKSSTAVKKHAVKNLHTAGANEVSSLLSQSYTAVSRQTVHKSSTAMKRNAMAKHALEKASTKVKKHAVKNSHTAMAKRAWKKSSISVKKSAMKNLHTAMAKHALEKLAAAKKKHAVKNLHTQRKDRQVK